MVLHKWIAYAALALSAGISTAHAADPLFKTVVVARAVSLEVPSHWKSLTDDERRNLAGSMRGVVRSLAEQIPEYYPSLAVASKPAGATIMVSVIEGTDLTQAEIGAALRTDRAATLQEIDAEFARLLPQFDKAVAATTGTKLRSREPIRVETIDGLICLIQSFIRTSPENGPDVRTTQIHVPMGPRKYIVSLTYHMDQAPVLRPILEEVKTSIRFLRQ